MRKSVIAVLLMALTVMMLAGCSKVTAEELEQNLQNGSWYFADSQQTWTFGDDGFVTVKEEEKDAYRVPYTIPDGKTISMKRNNAPVHAINVQIHDDELVFNVSLMQYKAVRQK